MTIPMQMKMKRLFHRNQTLNTICMPIGTLYIVPAVTDLAGQCRIVGRRGQISGAARDSYRADPSAWMEVGLMNSKGELVCLEEEFGAAGGWDELRDSQPLMAGSEFLVVLSDIEIDRPKHA